MYLNRIAPKFRLFFLKVRLSFSASEIRVAIALFELNFEGHFGIADHSLYKNHKGGRNFRVILPCCPGDSNFTCPFIQSANEVCQRPTVFPLGTKTILFNCFIGGVCRKCA